MFSLRCICRCRNQPVVGALGLKCYGSSATRQTASRFSTFVGIASAYVHLESRSFGSANVGAMTSMPGPFRPRTGTEERQSDWYEARSLNTAIPQSGSAFVVWLLECHPVVRLNRQQRASMARTTANTPWTMFPNSGGVNCKPQQPTTVRLSLASFRTCREPDRSQLIYCLPLPIGDAPS